MIMDSLVQFKKFKLTKTTIKVDVYYDGKYIVSMMDKISHIKRVKRSPIGIYAYFRDAALKYLTLHDPDFGERNVRN
jgi:hypothetical protein